jgi:hypothetical protein
MRRCLFGILLTVCLANAQEFVSRPERVVEAPKRGLWKASLAVLAAAQVMDIHSSFGCPEANGMLRSSGGTFGARAVGIKSGVIGAVVLMQYLSLRRSSRSARMNSAVNFAIAGATVGVAARNYAIRGQSRQ